MQFLRPILLFLAVPWAAVMAVWYLRQRRAAEWLGRRVSPRFIQAFTSYRGVLLPLHALILFGMGLLLVIAAAGPEVTGPGSTRAKADAVVFVIDASISMIGNDTQIMAGMPKPATRFDEAKAIAIKVMDCVPNYRYGVTSFSGIAAYHMPPTVDREAVTNCLKTLSFHTYEKTGTDFKAALETIVHLAENHHGGMQVVMLSDGEDVKGGDYEAEADVLKKRGIPVHTVGVGTETGVNLNIFNPRDVLEGKRNPSIAKTVTSRRKDEDLKKIAASTGGRYIVLERGDSIKDICKALESHYVTASSDGPSALRDASHWCIGAFAVIFFLDTLIFDGIILWRRVWRFFRDRLGGSK